MTAQHSPLPWKLLKYNPNVIVDIGWLLKEQDAQFVVTACNAYEKQQETISFLRQTIENVIFFVPAHFHPSDIKTQEFFLERLRVALTNTENAKLR